MEPINFKSACTKLYKVAEAEKETCRQADSNEYIHRQKAEVREGEGRRETAGFEVYACSPLTVLTVLHYRPRAPACFLTTHSIEA